MKLILYIVLADNFDGNGITGTTVENTNQE
jgi:hypothetical protein